MDPQTLETSLSTIDSWPAIFPSLTQEKVVLKGNHQKFMDYLTHRLKNKEPLAPEQDELNAEIQDFVDTINHEYETAQTEIVRHQALNSPHLVKHQSCDLLAAAATNDTVLLEEILAQDNIDINIKGKFGETPLHVAAIIGHVEATKLLLEHGADASIQAYTSLYDFDSGHTAMSLALFENHQDIVHLLFDYAPTNYLAQKELFTLFVEFNQSEALNLMIEKGTHLTFSHVILEDLAWEKLMDLIEHTELTEQSHSANDYQKLRDISETLILITNLTGTAITDDPYIDFGVPTMGIWIESYVALLKDPTAHEILLETAQKINAIDNNKDHYVLAKALFHIIPIEGDFNFQYDPKHSFQTGKALIDAEGFFNNYTVPLAHNALYNFVNNNTFHDSAQANAFHAALDAFALSADMANELGLMATSEKFYDALQNGQTIILPSGWTGHAVDIVLNTKLGLLAIANNGRSYHELESGATIFRMHHMDNITPDLIHDILVNEDQVNLELKLAAKLGLVEFQMLPEMPQFTGNCSWQSQESAIEGALFINLIEQGYNADKAAELAHTYYKQWDDYQTLHFVKEYFENDPRIDHSAVEAMIKTQAFLLETDDINIVKLNPIGAYLVHVYEDLYHHSVNDLQLNKSNILNHDDIQDFSELWHDLDIPLALSHDLDHENTTNAYSLDTLLDNSWYVSSETSSLATTEIAIAQSLPIFDVLQPEHTIFSCD